MIKYIKVIFHNLLMQYKKFFTSLMFIKHRFFTFISLLQVFFQANQPRQIISYLRTLKTLNICVKESVESICAASIFLEILQKESMEYKICIGKVKDEHGVYIDIETEDGIVFGSAINKNNNEDSENEKKNTIAQIEHTNEIENIDDENFDYGSNKENIHTKDVITKNNMTGDIKNKKRNIIIVTTTYEHNTSILSCLTFYEMAKNLNYVTNTIIWPVLVVLSQTNIVTVIDTSSEEQEETIELELSLQIKKLNKNKCEITKENTFYKPFLNDTNLFFVLSKDYNLLKKHKIIKHEKIRERLARMGVSLKEANESFLSISPTTKLQIDRCMKKTAYYQKKIEYEKMITAEENYYLILYYICRKKSLQGLLSLTQKEFVNNRYGKKIYEIGFVALAESIQKIKKIGKLFIFNIDKKYTKGLKREVFVKFCYDKIILLYEDYVDHPVVALETENEYLIVCKEPIIHGLKVNDFCYSVEKRMYKKTIEYLLKS